MFRVTDDVSLFVGRWWDDRAFWCWIMNGCLDWLKGMAVVMFTKKEYARKAIEKLNDTQFAGANTSSLKHDVTAVDS